MKIFLCSLIALLCLGAVYSHINYDIHSADGHIKCNFAERNNKPVPSHDFRSALSDMDLHAGHSHGSSSPSSSGSKIRGKSPFGDNDDFFGKSSFGKSPFGKDDDFFGKSSFGKSPFGKSSFGKGFGDDDDDFFKDFGKDFGSRFGKPGDRPVGEGFGSDEDEEGGHSHGDDEDGGRSGGNDGGEDLSSAHGPGRDPNAAPREKPQPVAPSVNGSDFRIHVDYSTLQVKAGPQRDYVAKLLVPSIADYFKAILKLKYPVVGKLKLPKSVRDCGGPIPSNYYTEGIDADLIMLIRVVNQPQESWIAGAMSCLTDKRSGRAVLSNVEINLAYLKLDDGDPLVHERNIYTTMHEMTHIFGFANDQYENFLNADGTPAKNVVKKVNMGGKTETVVDLPPLTKRLREHFACEKIPGALLESQGGAGSAGSHFERRVFFNEFLTASTFWESKVSEFTLAFLEGTGWYIVDYTRAEPFHAGDGKGCDFYFGKCRDSSGRPAFEEFCAEEGDKVCSISHAGAGTCSKDQFSDNCLLVHPKEDDDCRSLTAQRNARTLTDLQVYGPKENSKCFEGTLGSGKSGSGRRNTYCFNFNCVKQDNKTTLQVILGKTTVECKAAGPISVEGLSGKLLCPEPVHFCTMNAEPYCPRGCMGRGICANGKCKCNDGFTGFDCAYLA